jgi:hypothetical protein
VHELVGRTLAQRGEGTEARTHLHAAIALFEALGDQDGARRCRGRMAGAAFSEGNHDEARAIWGERLAAARRRDFPEGVGTFLEWLGNVALREGDAAGAAPLYQESRDVYRRIGDRMGEVHALLGIGLCAVARGDPDAAPATLLDCLRRQRELRDGLWLPFTLEGLAGVAAARDRPRRALTLAGAAEACRAAVGHRLWPIFQAQAERWLAPARAALPPEEQDRAWRQGLAMSVEQAIDYALAERTLDEPSLRDGR